MELRVELKSELVGFGYWWQVQHWVRWVGVVGVGEGVRVGKAMSVRVVKRGKREMKGVKRHWGWKGWLRGRRWEWRREYGEKGVGEVRGWVGEVEE